MAGTPTPAGSAPSYSDARKRILVYYDRKWRYTFEFLQVMAKPGTLPDELQINPNSGVKVVTVEQEDRQAPAAEISYKLTATIDDDSGLNGANIPPPPLKIVLRFKFTLNRGPNVSGGGSGAYEHDVPLGATGATAWGRSDTTRWSVWGSFVVDSGHFASGSALTARVNREQFIDEDVQREILQNTYWELNGEPAVVSAESRYGEHVVNLDTGNREKFEIDGMAAFDGGIWDTAIDILPSWLGGDDANAGGNKKKWYPAIKVELDLNAEDVDTSWVNDVLGALKNMISFNVQLDPNAGAAHQALTNPAYAALRDGLPLRSEAARRLIGVANFAAKAGKLWVIDPLVNRLTSGVGAGMQTDFLARKASEDDVQTELNAALAAHQAAEDAAAAFAEADAAANAAASQLFDAQQALNRATEQIRQGGPIPPNYGELQGAANDADFANQQAQAAANTAAATAAAASNNRTAKINAVNQAITDFENKKRAVRAKVTGSATASAIPTSDGVLASLNFGLNVDIPPGPTGIPVVGIPLLGQGDLKYNLGLSASVSADLVFMHTLHALAAASHLASLGITAPVPETERWPIELGPNSGWMFGNQRRGQHRVYPCRFSPPERQGHHQRSVLRELRRPFTRQRPCGSHHFGEPHHQLVDCEGGARPSSLFELESPTAQMDFDRISDGFDFTSGWQIYVLGIGPL